MSFSVLRALAVAALSVSSIMCAAGCSVDVGANPAPIGAAPEGTPTCMSAAGGPVTVYSAVPTVGATWWTVGQEPADVAADLSGDASSSGGDDTTADTSTPPPPADPSTDSGSADTSSSSDSSDDTGADTGDDTDDSGDDDTSDDADTDAVHPSNLGGACYSCDLTCTTVAPGPGQPAAISIAHGASSRSHGAACAAAERTLRHYASTSYGLNLNACGYDAG